MALAIGVDIGGTRVKAGIVDERGSVLATAGRATPSHDVALTADAIVAVVEELRADPMVARSVHVSGADAGGFEVSGSAGAGGVTAVGIGAAGWIDRGRTTVLFAPNLAWRDEPLGERLAPRLGLPVLVENDANAAAWAEYRFGAARGEEVVVMVTLGTGIGGGLVIGGEVYRGAYGIGPEFGHLRVVPDGRRCGCGNRGCWEQYASAKALVREARDLAEGAPLSAEALLAAVGSDLSALRGEVVAEVALAGDPGARECFEDIGRWLGVGLASLAAAYDPSCFVIGGGLLAAGELLLGPARQALATHLSGRGHRPMASVRAAALGNAAGLVGAADLARASLGRA